ncbi:hypothetical protein LRS73_26755 [Methylobacterium currus]|uniref:hypothetical protein n=1 Tax=Methylobacterium currus TaxID=2051553 RepID=UPI001E32B990|nr:hypothetical protein [Methylobacterium currus]UHC16036.1 hypothetical protein LRS73_26755 [Methylobacterium currus]
MMAATAAPGHNNPPAPTPFELSRDEIESLCGEARHWLDGAGVKTAAEADGVAKLLNLLRTAIKRADERRIAEAKPHDEAKAEIQARYGALIQDNKSGKGKAVLAAEACRAALTAWLERQEAEKQAAATEARRVADERAREAALALQLSKPSDLEDREHAEDLAQEARRAEAAAGRAEKDRAVARGGARAVTLRTTYRAEVTDATAFARWAWVNCRDEIDTALADIASRQVAAGTRNIPGVAIHEDRKAV